LDFPSNRLLAAATSRRHFSPIGNTDKACQPNLSLAQILVGACPPDWRSPATLPESRRAPSVREAEMQDVAVGDDVVLALETEPAGLARPRFAAAGDVILVSDGFHPDEPLLEVRMDDARRLGRLRPLLDRPGAGFFRA